MVIITQEEKDLRKKGLRTIDDITAELKSEGYTNSSSFPSDLIQSRLTRIRETLGPLFYAIGNKLFYYPEGREEMKRIYRVLYPKPKNQKLQ